MYIYICGKFIGQYTIRPMDPVVEKKVFDLTYNNCWGGGGLILNLY